MKLALGRISITPSAALALMLADTHVFVLIARHALGDWGVGNRSDNLKAIEEGKRVFAPYTLPRTGAEVWVITNAERTETAVMLAEEYR